MSRLSTRFCLRLLTALVFTIPMVTVGFGHQRVTTKDAPVSPEILAIYGEAAADFCGEFSDSGKANADSCPLCRLVDAATLPEPLCFYRKLEYVALPERVAETAVLPQVHARTSHGPRAPPTA
jgi:hypothetical protein